MITEEIKERVRHMSRNEQSELHYQLIDYDFETANRAKNYNEILALHDFVVELVEYRDSDLIHKVLTRQP